MPKTRKAKRAEGRRSTIGELVAMAYEEVKTKTRDPERAERITALAVVRFLLKTGNLRAARALAESST